MLVYQSTLSSSDNLQHVNLHNSSLFSFLFFFFFFATALLLFLLLIPQQLKVLYVDLHMH